MSAKVWPEHDAPGTGGGKLYMPRVWSGGRNKNGWSLYEAQWLVNATESKDGPDIVLRATGIPVPGDPWVYGNDVRNDVVCLPQRKANRFETTDPGFWWVVDTEFSNDAAYLGPVISINGQKYSKEVFRDRFGKALLTTCHERIKSPQAEFDFNRMQVEIEYPKKLTLDLPLWTVLVNSGSLNSVVMWGFPERCVKMEPYTVIEKWDESFGKYFGVVFRFTTYVIYDKDGVPTSGFDRDVLNEGTKALGFWKPHDTSPNIADATWDTFGGNVANPRDYFRYYDKAGNIATVILNEDGTPWTGVNPDDPPKIHVEHYPQSDLVTLLGLPNPLYG